MTPPSLPFLSLMLAMRVFAGQKGCSMADFTKDPDDILDYGFNWGSQWLSTSEIITSSSWTASAGITIGNGSNGAGLPTYTNTATTVWVIGGTAGQPYTLTNRITTNQGRQVDRTMTIRVVNK